VLSGLSKVNYDLPNYYDSCLFLHLINSCPGNIFISGEYLNPQHVHKNTGLDRSGFQQVSPGIGIK
jgi:hypothetical protein